MENQPEQRVMDISEQFPNNWFWWGRRTWESKPQLLYIADTVDELLQVTFNDLENQGYVDYGQGSSRSLLKGEVHEIGGVFVD